jgi:phosphatidylglycerophosphate synthase
VRPRSPEDAVRAADALREHPEERLVLDAAVKARDGFFTTFFVSPYSRHIARFAARRGWTPNAITMTSAAVGVVAAAAFAVGSRAASVAGAVLLQAAFTLDCVDGQLARYTLTFSPFGAWLDSVLDRVKEYVVYAGLAIGAAGFHEDVWVLAAAALTLQTFRHMLDFSFAASRHALIRALPRRPIEDPDDGTAGVATEVEGDARAPVPAPTGGARVLAMAGALDRWTLTRWARRVFLLPIGGRFALISVTAALATPRVTFIALLAWGGVTATYAVIGRTLRSVAT